MLKSVFDLILDHLNIALHRIVWLLSALISAYISTYYYSYALKPERRSRTEHRETNSAQSPLGLIQV